MIVPGMALLGRLDAILGQFCGFRITASDIQQTQHDLIRMLQNTNKSQMKK